MPGQASHFKTAGSMSALDAMAFHVDTDPAGRPARERRMDATSETVEDLAAGLLSRLGPRSIVFVGLMGAGKTAIGRRVSQVLGLPFVDSDHEIESVSRMSIPELFERYGEPEFRALEERVVTRLVKQGPNVVSTGGGAFMNANSRAAISHDGVSIWLKADIDTLMARVVKKPNRPLLKTADPRAVMQKLIDERYPVYATADVTVTTRDARREDIAGEVVAALAEWLKTNEAGARP